MMKVTIDVDPHQKVLGDLQDARETARVAGNRVSNLERELYNAKISLQDAQAKLAKAETAAASAFLEAIGSALDSAHEVEAVPRGGEVQK